MNSRGSSNAALGAEVYRLPFAVQGAKRFVLSIFGGLTLMVSIWAALMLGNSIPALGHESRALFTGILVFFVVLIVAGFSAAWWVLSRYPHAFVVRERAVVLEHGARTRVVPFEDVLGLDQRAEDGTYVVAVADGSAIPFGNDHESRAAARALVERAGLEWTQEPFRATRASTNRA